MKRHPAVFLAAAGLLPLLLATPSLALPRFSARYEQNCGLCHVNPTGGGQRSLYAAQFIVPAEMSMHRLSQDQMANIDPQLSKNVSIGLDFRTMHHHADRASIPYEDFLQMEGAVDLTFQPDPRFLAYVSKGLSTTTEVFGMLTVLPYNGYVKVGWFMPAYGWRFDDHTQYVRQKAMSTSNSASDLDGPPPPLNDVGVELATFPKRLALTVSLLNGNLGSNLDNNKMPGYAAQAIYRWNVHGLGMGLGGSVWRNYEPQGRRTQMGPYGYLKWNRVTWLGESDWSRLRVSGTGGGPTSVSTTWVVSQELAVLLARGVEIRGTFDFFDPNIYLKTGARQRFGAGFDVIPYPYLDIQATVNVHHYQIGADVAGQDYTQSEIQVHFFY